MRAISARQLLLGAVVDVALDPAALGVVGLHQPLGEGGAVQGQARVAGERAHELRIAVAH